MVQILIDVFFLKQIHCIISKTFFQVHIISAIENPYSGPWPIRKILSINPTDTLLRSMAGNMHTHNTENIINVNRRPKLVTISNQACALFLMDHFIEYQMCGRARPRICARICSNFLIVLQKSVMLLYEFVCVRCGKAFRYTYNTIQRTHAAGRIANNKDTSIFRPNAARV